MVIPRRLRQLALVLLLLGVPLLFLQANLKAAGSTNAVDRLLLRASAPVQAAVTTAASAVHGFWRRYVALIGAQQRLDTATAHNEQLRLELREARRQLGGLSECQRLLGFRAERGVETVGARVIGRPASPFVRAVRLRIDQGSVALATGLPVVTADGVVGRTSRVYSGYSDVQLAVDPKSSIDVVIQRTGGRGLLKGIDGSNRYRCRVDYLLRDEEIRVGDAVVTSGAAGVFPKGLPVGRVSQVKGGGHGLYQEVEVVPSVDFATVERVLIVLAPPPPPVGHARSPTTSAYGLTP